MNNTACIINNAWIFFILATIINAFILKIRSRKLIADHPDLEAGLNQLIKGFLIYLNLPWIVMGIGMVCGEVPGIFKYLNPREGNPFVIAFHITMLILWILFVWWLYFNSGAEFLVKYPRVFNLDLQSSTNIKVLLAFPLIGGIIAMALMWIRT